jgi:hypothetical protein
LIEAVQIDASSARPRSTVTISIPVGTIGAAEHAVHDGRDAKK